MANRHGLIAGATGTGKTVTLQTLAEGFSDRGIPVFMADVKGDLAGMSQPGGNNPKIVSRAGAWANGFQTAGFARGFLGCLRRERPPGVRHCLGDGPTAPGASSKP